MIEIETDEQEQLIEELNRDMAREDKRNETARRRIISLEWLNERFGFEFPSKDSTLEDIYIAKIEQEMRKMEIKKALEKLTPRQREVVEKVYFELYGKEMRRRKKRRRRKKMN